MQIGRSLFLSFVIAGKSKGNTFEQWELDAKTRPRFGRNWWYWVPSLTTNGGRFKNYENTDVSFHWLCFSLSLTKYASEPFKERELKHVAHYGLEIKYIYGGYRKGFYYSNESTGFNEIFVEFTDDQRLIADDWINSSDKKGISEADLVKGFLKDVKK